MSHRHYCDYAGHDWQCVGICECICGLPMEGNDHSECSVELRACPEHSAAQQLSDAEATSSEPDPAFASDMADVLRSVGRVPQDPWARS